ncbi:anhydro-N-acetylmuramic acid kinase [Haloactinospora alba]|uniref:Anhydro-N-acetylmuramic acid kinase n=1 Tax=Haloactinospora alba TaxID=405555 RepID=A0A543NKC5_9ACTN|nr:anhydro-N-acetylmuramic acid kinase [Haloactinospora alba]TQN32272.1 anhydro-N-acetylmuramic acid kinase [Haloactinospora alba]
MRVIGLSSGTSIDGIDVAAADLELTGDLLRMTPLGHRTVPYSPHLRRTIGEALPPAPTTMETVCRIDTLAGQEFAAAAARGAAELTGDTAELVASHGQTLFHWVEEGRTAGSLQLGQPAWISERTGLPVVADLRAADVAAGGQGAPLASVLDVLLLHDRPAPAAALNLGGIANVTVARGDAPETAFDTGPGNALLDAAASRVTDGREHADTGGRWAASGNVADHVLRHLLSDPYYQRAPPKTTGKERFHAGYLADAIGGSDITAADLMATLTELTAVTVADALRPHGVGEVLASGGGTRNPVLMRRLADRLRPARLIPTDDIGLDSDAKEAYLFALLGFLTWNGLSGSLPGCTGARRAPVAGSITPGTAPLRLPAPHPTFPTRMRIDDARH